MVDQSYHLTDSFPLMAKPITPDDIAPLHALSVAVGWMHRAEDWAVALRLGEGIFLTDEIGRPFGSAMWFPVADDLGMVGMVITTPRLQERGAGTWMMQQILGRTGGRDLGLNATRAAFRLYLTLGFQAGLTVWQHQGVVTALTDAPTDATAPYAASARVRPMRPEDRAAIHALDTRAYTAHRRVALDMFLDHSTGTVSQDAAGRITGYALCRRFGRGHVVGPIVAADADEAAALTAPHLAEHMGRYIRIDTRETEGAFIDLLNNHGLRMQDSVTTMTLGHPRPVDAGAHIYALAIQAIG